jgi:predicted flap endonuclease-1-like 5' DNA nuclease
VINPDLSASLPVIIIAVVVLAGAIWLFLRANRKTTIIDEGVRAKDVLDEGAERASRNQALIDAAPAVVKPAPDAVVAAAEPAPAPAPAPAQASADDLARIKGVGPKLVALLGELGVTSFAQIAAWSDADIARIDTQLGRFAGRITRDQWVEQAQLLSQGDETGFAAKFGKNG